MHQYLNGPLFTEKYEDLFDGGGSFLFGDTLRFLFEKLIVYILEFLVLLDYLIGGIGDWFVLWADETLIGRNCVFAL